MEHYSYGQQFLYGEKSLYPSPPLTFWSLVVTVCPSYVNSLLTLCFVFVGFVYFPFNSDYFPKQR
jgi:hypothetical protein